MRQSRQGLLSQADESSFARLHGLRESFARQGVFASCSFLQDHSRPPIGLCLEAALVRDRTGRGREANSIMWTLESRVWLCFHYSYTRLFASVTLPTVLNPCVHCT